MTALPPFKDPVLELVIRSAQSTAFVQKVWVFGSRARGDASEKSDYDLAFELALDQEGLDAIWAEFCTVLREQNPRLNQLDLVRVDQAGPRLKSVIMAEGKELYGKL